MASQRVLLFGDQSVEKLPSIRNIVRLSQSSATLQKFLRDALDVIQYEITQGTPEERKRFGPSQSLMELADFNAAQEEPEETIGTVLICVVRIGELILHSEQDPSLLSIPKNLLHVVGLCGGLLPGSVAVLASNPLDAASIGLQIVAISFRLALECSRRSRRVEDTSASWGSTVVGLPSDHLAKILSKYNERKGLPTLRHAYVGITSKSWTTVFGPPSVLEDMWNDVSELKLAPKLKVAGATAVHSPNLPIPDLEKIMGSSSILETPLPNIFSFVSSSTCKSFQASTFKELLGLLLLDITQHTLRMESTMLAVAQLVKAATKEGHKTVELTVVGPSPHTTLAQRALGSSGATVSLTSALEATKVAENLRGGSDLVAIVGMGGRFPGGENLAAFWDMLQTGKDMHSTVPENRFTMDQYYGLPGGQKDDSLFGCFMEKPGLFDCRLFNISPREALQMDPVQRMLMMTSYEALEMAGYVKDGSIATDSRRIATYFGQTTNDWCTINDQQGAEMYYVPGGIRAFAPGRLNYYHKWGGGYYSLDTACSGSLSSIALACNALRSREVDTALAGGGNVLLTPELFAGLKRGGFLSGTGNCKTFRDDADGYCRGEGVGVVVLKRLEDAIADNDNIQAVIRGSARSSSVGAPSITQSHTESQQDLIKKILHQASVNPLEVGFVEMHGTATANGDPVEMSAVLDQFGKGRTKDNQLVIGAVKANIGHSEAAAGIASLIKSIFILKTGDIPPQPGMPFALNHKYPALDKLNVRIASSGLRLRPWSKGDGKRKILINNFDAAGGNTSIIIEDAPKRASTGTDQRSHHVIATSARTPFSFLENKRRLREYLENNPDVKIADLAYTTTARRQHEVYRDSYVAQSVQDIVRSLDADLKNENKKPKATGANAPIVFIFTGQGSSYAGMGKELYRTSSKFRELILSYQNLCEMQGLPSFIYLISTDAAEDNFTPAQKQVAIVALEIALANLWISWGFQPECVLGHSLGEYAALCIAGVLSVSDALFLVGKRALLIEDKCTPFTHGMTSVSASPAKLAELLSTEEQGRYEIACLNAPEATVISGSLEDIKNITASLEGKEVKATLLSLPHAFHSAQIDAILADYETVAKTVNFSKPSIPIVSTLLATVVQDDKTFNAAYLTQQARKSVNWIGALQALKEFKPQVTSAVFLEIGPRPLLSGMVRSTLQIPATQLLPTLKSGEADWRIISATMSSAFAQKVDINWQEFHKDHVQDLSLVDLPTYAFETKEFWLAYKPAVSSAAAPAVTVAAAAPVSIQAHAGSTASVQRLIASSKENGKISATFESNTSEANLFKAIKGHVVDGNTICPASVFYDMALTAAKFVYEQENPRAVVPSLELQDLDIHHALVVTEPDPTQTVTITASKAQGSPIIHIGFSSKTGGVEQEIGSSSVQVVGQTEITADVARNIHLVKKRVDSLNKLCQAGAGHRLLRPIMYKLFATLVEYGADYQAVEEVCLEDDFSDAAATIKLQALSHQGAFAYQPYWVDSVIHLAGFILNGNFARPKDTIYIASGMQSVHVRKELFANQAYTCYASSRPSEKKGVILGDVYLFDSEGELAALITGIKFQQMTRAIFAFLTGRGSSTPASKAIAAPKALKATTAASASLAPPRPVINRAGSDASAASSVFSETGAPSGPMTPATTVSEDDNADEAETLLKFVAQETGVSIDEFEASTRFADIGVDSLMSVSIMSAFKKETGNELPASFFQNFVTVADVREELGSTGPPPAAVAAPAVSVTATSTATAPASAAAPATAASSSEPAVADLFLEKIAAETGVDVSEMEPSMVFADIGVDSLMSVAIMAAFKKDTGIELPASFFQTFRTVAEVVEELGGSNQEEPTPAPVVVAAPAPAAKPVSAPAPTNVQTVVKATPRAKVVEEEEVSGEPFSRCVLIQGKSKSTETPLFLITDGSGSVTSYIYLPPLPQGRRIYALESPFAARPEDYLYTIPEMAACYLAAIRKAQPTGPYMIGGWSAGAVYAYETARLLLSQGEKMLGFLIIDMRVPQAIPDAIEPTMELVEQTGLLTGVNRATSLLDSISHSQKMHLLMTLRALVKFEPQPMALDARPDQSFIVWATKGLSDGDDAEDVIDEKTAIAVMGPVGQGVAEEDPQAGLKSWFHGKRYTFGTNGWETLIGDNITCTKMDADHFSMVVPPRVTELGRLVLQAVAQFTENEQK